MSITTTTPMRRAVELPPHMTAALADLYAARATRLPRADDPAGMAAESWRQMMVSARLAAWWTLLGRWIVSDSDLPLLLGRAATIAGDLEWDEAQRWRARLTHCGTAQPSGRAER